MADLRSNQRVLDSIPCDFVVQGGLNDLAEERQVVVGGGQVGQLVQIIGEEVANVALLFIGLSDPGEASLVDVFELGLESNLAIFVQSKIGLREQ